MTAVSLPLATQLRPPRLPFAFVERPRLLAALDRASADAITLVSGPLGSGKTSLLTSWAQSRPPEAPVAWLSLSAEDDDPIAFWSAVLAALRQDDAGSPVGALAAPAQPTDAAFISRLINALAAGPNRRILVLEDIHLLRSRQCVR